MKMIYLTLCFAISATLLAQTDFYKDTDNQGLNKKERIDSIEKYLTDLSKSVKSMEAKLDENEKRFKGLEEVVKAIKVQEAMAAAKKVGEVADTKITNPEVLKLKAEFDSLKSKDVEKLKTDVQSLTDTLKSIQLIMKSQKY